MTIITLLTDFGYQDGYPGIMKGVIWKIAPDVRIADLSHDIPPQNVLAASLVLGRAALYYPDGTIHLAVVDPGVGTMRRGIAAQLGNQCFVGPDNGLITHLLEVAERKSWITTIVLLNQPQYWLPEISKTFHGRDIFAPVAAYLATGLPLKLLGTPIDDPVRLDIPQPVRTPSGWLGQVIYIDHFGNLSTNLDSRHLSQSNQVTIKIKDRQINGLDIYFADKPPGTLIALLDSSGSLTISVVNGSAEKCLFVNRNDPVELFIN